MISAIENNPFRILGVYSNASAKDIASNESKLKAFLKVEQPIEFQLDLNKCLPKLDRTIIMVNNAKQSISLSKDKIGYSLFWFMHKSMFDDIAINSLSEGNINQAIGTWIKKETMSSLINCSVCFLINNDYRLAFYYISKVLNDDVYLAELLEAVTGASYRATSDELIKTYVDEIIAGYKGDISFLADCANDPKIKTLIIENSVSPLISNIQICINKVESIDESDGKSQYNAGLSLVNDTRQQIKDLKHLMSVSNVRFQMIADKLGITILQCGINYYNNTNDADAAYKAKELQDYAFSIVLGQAAKDRCKENLMILNRIIADLPDIRVINEDRAIKNELSKFEKLPDKISYSIDLLNNTKPQLNAIKMKLGSNNDYYLKISTIVVNSALYNLIEEVNAIQNKLSDIANNESTIYQRDRLNQILLYNDAHNAFIKTLAEAWKATSLIDQFDMEEDFKQNRYLPNRNTLKELYDNCTKKSTPPSPPEKKEESSKGCIVMLIVIVLFVVFLIFYCNNSGTSNNNSNQASTEEVEQSSKEEASTNVVESTKESIPDYVISWPETGTEPYSSYYSKNLKNASCYFKVNTTGNADVVVIVKDNNGTVVGNLYIRGGDSGIIYVNPGSYEVFFYSGTKWSYGKSVTEGKDGAFTSDEGITKDGNVIMEENQYMTYDLQPTRNGNFSPSSSNAEEMMN